MQTRGSQAQSIGANCDKTQSQQVSLSVQFRLKMTRLIRLNCCEATRNKIETHNRDRVWM